MDEYLLNDLLECAICLDRLDTSGKVLPCQHTFCKKCLEEIVAAQKELRCPECRVLVNKSVDELPPNVLLMRILEGMKNAGNPKRKAPPLQKHQPALSSNVVTTTQNLPCTGDTPKRVFHNAPSKAGFCGPLGRALFDYQSLEPGDLSFRKGDMITLLSKIDAHWAQGECAGRTGIFPLTFIQVLTPLPPQVATCRALYDFRMNNEEVEGCLSFRKDDILAVLRRVDENWIEGRLSGRVGIFPLAFVELNPVAKALMKLSINEQPGPSRLAPPTPTADESSPLINTDGQNTPDRLIANSVDSTRPTPGPMAPVTGCRPSPPSAAASPTQIIRPTASDSSSTTTTTPNSTSNSSGGSSSSTAASSPASPHQSSANYQKTNSPQPTVQSQTTPTPNQPIGLQHSTPPLRCSDQTQISQPIVSPPQPHLLPQQQHARPETHFSLLPPNSANHLQSLHQHSAMPQQQTSPPQVSSSNTFMRPQTILLPTSHITTQQRDKRHSFTAISSNQPVPSANRHSAEILSSNEPSTAEAELTSAEHIRTPGVGQSRDSTPNPADSALVRSGSQRHRRSGSDFAVVHLPAAYVALYPYKPQKADELELKKGGVYLVTERCQDGWFKGTSNRTQKCGVFPGNYVTLAKPTQGSHSRVVSSSPRDCSTPNPTAKSRTPTPAARLPAQVSLAPPELPPRSASPAVRQSRHIWTGGNSPLPLAEPDSAAGASGVARTEVATPHNSQASNFSQRLSKSAVHMNPAEKPVDKTKEKKEKCGIMKRLAAIKRSKSPTVPAYSMDNPVFEDASVAPPPASAQLVAHSRSGSCPSQLLHLPVSVQSRVMSTSLSARATKQKERPSVGPAHFTQAPSRIDASPFKLAATHRKSSSLDDGDPRNPKHLVPTVRERFRCIVPYPPNSDFELELRLGDIIYVHRKRDDGWYKGTQQRTGRTGLFPASFVESC